MFIIVCVLLIRFFFAIFHCILLAIYSNVLPLLRTVFSGPLEVRYNRCQQYSYVKMYLTNLTSSLEKTFGNNLLRENMVLKWHLRVG